MYFEPTFFDGEVREGFYITSMMKRAWAAQLEVLKEIEKVCKNHNLIYFAEFGTLLGAIRHKGFIPWDDDVDISMSRKDLNIFLKYAEEELPKGYRVFTPKDNFKEFLIRVVNTDKMNTSFNHMNKFHGFPFIAGIDVFIYDDIAPDKEEENLQLDMMAITHVLAYNWEEGTEEEKKEKLETLYQLEKLCNYKFDHDKPYGPQLLQLAHYLAAMYNDDNAKEVGILYRLKKYPKCRYPKEYIKEVMEVPFESTTIFVPTHYDDILKCEYTNHMVFRKRTCGHDYPYFKDQRDILLESAKERKITLPDYFYEEIKY